LLTKPACILASGLCHFQESISPFKKPNIFMHTFIGTIIILFFVLVTAVTIWGMIRLRQMGLLQGFMRGKWVASTLSLLFLVQFIVASIALIVGARWATPVMRYTIILWLVYLWIYGLGQLIKLWGVLHDDQATRLSDFMGRDQFFDQLINKTVEMNAAKAYIQPVAGHDTEETGQAAPGSEMVDLLNDEFFFEIVLPVVIRKKIRRKLIGLAIHTAIFIIFLMLL
jgi:hypothetical protein